MGRDFVLFPSMKANTFPDPESANERSHGKAIADEKEATTLACALKAAPLDGLLHKRGFAAISLLHKPPLLLECKGRGWGISRAVKLDELQLPRPWRHTPRHPAGRAAGKGSGILRGPSG